MVARSSGHVCRDNRHHASSFPDADVAVCQLIFHLFDAQTFAPHQTNQQPSSPRFLRTTMPLFHRHVDSHETTFQPIRASFQVHKKIALYVERNAFVLVSGDDILEIQFDECQMLRREKYEPSKEARIYEIYGVVGILKGFLSKYLIVISSCKHRGNICKQPVYVISKVSCLELHYQNACKTLNQHQRQQFVDSDNEGEGDNDSDSNDDSSSNNADDKNRSTSSLISPIHDQIDHLSPPRPIAITGANMSSKVRTVASTLAVSPSPKPSTSFLTKMKFPFGMKPSPSPNLNDEPGDLEDVESVSTDDSGPITSTGIPNAVTPVTLVSSSAHKFSLFGTGLEAKEAAALAARASPTLLAEERYLDQRMVRELNTIFSGDMILFAYDFDLTNTFQRKHGKGAGEQEKPLWQQVDKRFFWNEKLVEDFIKQELHEWILPVTQGSLQIEACEVEGFAFDFILISRRSRERAGLRYQRRGLNEHGHVANFVETEQIVAFEREDMTHHASFVQTRGSIPLFWSQTPYGLHPVPVLERSEAENEIAFEHHFADQVAKYGPQVAINLTELHGREAIVGGEYRSRVEHLAETNIKYVCRIRV
ncbi:hypothetical protein BC936DRAFT_138303 [Jimgerdemannia flammicorona]|uniref:SAC domain-containing protein n=1 Tax=Jimgerdemannia flammicorona TaxID=994334 RepID=A0A433DIF4_9FUNG|nr:hypothetical protein BC936DRAFT_138303 [Jimgerdemannia flammicorona]